MSVAYPVFAQLRSNLTCPVFVEAPLEESASVAVTVSEDNVDDASASVYEPVRFEGMPAADTPEAQGSSLLDEVFTFHRSITIHGLTLYGLVAESRR